MFACQEGHEHVVEALLKRGVTVDIQDEVIPVIVSPPPLLCPHAYVRNVRNTKLHALSELLSANTLCYSTVVLKQ